jgi:hypothetical protein
MAPVGSINSGRGNHFEVTLMCKGNTMQLHILLFIFQLKVLNPDFITCHNLGQERFPFLTVMCSQLQMKSLAVTFVFWLYLSRNPFTTHIKGIQGADNCGNAWRIQVSGM